MLEINDRHKHKGPLKDGSANFEWYPQTMAITIYGVCAVSFMMAMYAFEGRDRRFIVAFAFGCLLSSAYGFLSGAWPFGVVEFIWSGVALRRYSKGDSAF